MVTAKGKEGKEEKEIQASFQALHRTVQRKALAHFEQLKNMEAFERTDNAVIMALQKLRDAKPKNKLVKASSFRAEDALTVNSSALLLPEGWSTFENDFIALFNDRQRTDYVLKDSDGKRH